MPAHRRAVSIKCRCCSAMFHPSTVWHRKRSLGLCCARSPSTQKKRRCVSQTAHRMAWSPAYGLKTAAVSSAWPDDCARVRFSSTITGQRAALNYHLVAPGNLATGAKKALRRYTVSRSSRRLPSDMVDAEMAKSLERMQRRHPDDLIVGLVSVSDRASSGEYEDAGIPALRSWLESALEQAPQFVTRLVPDERETVSRTLVELVDDLGCDLVLTTGGTGPARRDITPEATLDIATREMPGFGEQMRQVSLAFVPTAILSRQVAVLRETADHAALIINLPGQPKAIRETLEGLRDDSGKVVVNGVFAAVPYCLDLIGGPYIETRGEVVKAFRPKNAIRRPAGA